ncbi:MAG: S1C family serine protease [Thermoguttaceae bacterium]|nr:S1C family serine protease [Thermoguttaceae bacterium]
MLVSGSFAGPVCKAGQAGQPQGALDIAPARFAARPTPDVLRLEEEAFYRAATSAARSVVRLEWVGGRTLLGERLPGGATATGLLVDESGLILTSTYFFLDRPDALIVRFSDGKASPGRLLGRDFNRMVALVQAERKGSDLLPTRCPAEEIEVGMWAIALGWTITEQPHLAVGIVSAKRRIWGKAIQTDANTSPHNYGGPLVDINGRVLGIIVPFSPDGRHPIAGVHWYDSGIGFAVPLSDVLSVVPRLAKGEDLFPGRAGIQFEHPNPILAEPVVAAVEPGSAADKAGLKPGDRIVRIAGREVRRAADVEEVFQQHYGGDTLTVAIERAGQRQDFLLTLAPEIWPGLKSLRVTSDAPPSP